MLFRSIAIEEADDDETNTEGPHYEPRFNAQDLVKILPAKGEFEFHNKHGFTMTMTRRKYTSYHYDAF